MLDNRPAGSYNIAMKIALVYLAVINFIAFGLMGADKRRAQKHRWRIAEHTLFAVALAGGSVGAILGMYLWHHKTKHWYFVLGMPLILFLQLALASVLFAWQKGLL